MTLSNMSRRDWALLVVGFVGLLVVAVGVAVAALAIWKFPPEGLGQR